MSDNKKDTIEVLEYLISVLKEETVKVESCKIDVRNLEKESPTFDSDRPFKDILHNAMHGNQTIRIDIDLFDNKNLPPIN